MAIFLRRDDCIRRAARAFSAPPGTISAWVCTTDAGIGVANQVCAIGLSHRLALYIAADGFPNAYAFNGTTVTQAFATRPVNPGVWTHLCAVFTSNVLREIFVNGTHKITSTVTNGASPADGGTTIGGLHITPNFDGFIAEVALWDRALQDQEVRALAGIGTDGQISGMPYLIRPDGLVAYLPLQSAGVTRSMCAGAFHMDISIGAPLSAPTPAFISSSGYSHVNDPNPRGIRRHLYSLMEIYRNRMISRGGLGRQYHGIGNSI